MKPSEKQGMSSKKGKNLRRPLENMGMLNEFDYQLHHDPVTRTTVFKEKSEEIANRRIPHDLSVFQDSTGSVTIARSGTKSTGKL
ncbi:UNVERIFIED_CONTAM: hypothetical protein NCL1_13989 [Trichonephila clavipes]